MKDRSRIAAVLLGILALALRLIALDVHSPLIDEGFVGLGARDIAYHHTPMWDAISNAPYVWMLAKLVQLFGDNLYVLRLPSAIAGTAAVLIVFYNVRKYYSDTVAILSAALVALHPFCLAFTRIAFADALQLPFLLAGLFYFDRIARSESRPAWVLSLLCWAFAFVLKYNAVIIGALWLITAVILRRYAWKQLLQCSTVLVGGIVLAFLPWPIDLGAWFFAFASKAAATRDSADFFFAHFNIVYLGGGLTLLAAVIALYKYAASNRTALHWQLLLTSILYFFILVILGREFQRYLLILIPLNAIVIAAGSYNAYNVSRERQSTLSISCLAILVALPVWSMNNAAWSYLSYLQNDVDLRQVVARVTQLEDADPAIKAYWSVDPSVSAYELGFTQFYSRATKGSLDGAMAQRNACEALPFAQDTFSYGILFTRHLLHNHLFEALHDLKQTLASLTAASQDAKQRRQQAVDKYSQSFVRGDLLIMEAGYKSVIGEPFLRQYPKEEMPPITDHLPLDTHELLYCFNSRGESSTIDTTIDSLQYKIWVLRKR